MGIFTQLVAIQVVSIVVAITISTPVFLAAVVPLGLVYYYIQKYYGWVSHTCTHFSSLQSQRRAS